MIDFTLSDEQKALQRLAHDFAENEIRPIAKEVDRNPDPDKSFPWEVYKKGLQLGFGKLLIPEKYGGHGGGLIDYCLVLEELAWGDAGISAGFFVTMSLGRVLSLALSEEQKEKWLRSICEDESGAYLLAGAFTEPSGGTEIIYTGTDPTHGVRATAVRSGDEYVINGSKCFTTNAGVAKLYIIMPRTDMTKPNVESCSMFLVPADTPGLTIGKIEDKMGHRGSRNGEVFLDDVRVPKENLIGEEGAAFEIYEQTFQTNPIGVGISAVGLARAAYETALSFASERKIWGRPIREYESVSDKLVEMRMKIEAARALIWKVCWAVEHPESGAGLDKLVTMAKIYPCELAIGITADAIQVLGGVGYMKDYPTEKYMRDALVLPIRDCTNEILKVNLAKKL